MAKKTKMTREEISWILYDVANSAFVLVMITAIMPIYFKDVAAQGIPNAVSTANWGFANSAAALIVALLAPILGTLADYKDRKKLFFLFFLSVGVLFNLSLPFVSAGQWLLCLVLFICARVGWAGANIFYDAFLVDVTSHKRMDMISARGYAFGYIGSVIPFLIIISLILTAGKSDSTLPISQTRIGFCIVALWWLLLSIPAIKTLKQIHYLEPTPEILKDSFRRLATTFTSIKKHRQVFWFLLAYFFYIDGVGTIISMSTAYGRDLGFGVTLLIVVLLFIQIVAFPFALLYGKLAGRFTTRKMLMTGIFVYCLVTILAFLLPFIEDMGTKTALFWFIAFLVASSMGGVQALSRSYFGKLIPPENSAEFFGFYNVFGKFAAITGPFLMGIVGRLTGDSRWGVLSILVLFIIGAYFLTKVEDSSPDATSPPVSNDA
jgi:UMF1 family MFS transporter